MAKKKKKKSTKVAKKKSGKGNGRGKKTCPQCGKVLGARTAECECGHKFSTTTKKKKRKEPIEELIGTGAPPRPENLPADFEQLHLLLRRILFEVPPGRPPKGDGSATDEMVRVRRLPTRLAKLKLIDTLRDLAIEDIAFARHVLPLLREFKQSRGKSEQAACLVAVTRIEHHHEELVE